MFAKAECAKCALKADKRACRDKDGNGPDFCPTKYKQEVIEKAKQVYQDPEIYEFARQSSIQEAQCYVNRDRKPPAKQPVKSRLKEIIEFAQKMDYKTLGLAYCAGLQSEAGKLSKVLEFHDFEVASVVCKVGCTPKEFIGVRQDEKVRIGEYESMCSPIAQAEILNEAGTDFNILLGLCVGHDSLFFKYTDAMTTVFAVKDRVLGHNSLAALYTLDSYYESLIKIKDH